MYGGGVSSGAAPLLCVQAPSGTLAHMDPVSIVLAGALAAVALLAGGLLWVAHVARAMTERE